MDIDRPAVRIAVNPGGTNAQFDKDTFEQKGYLVTQTAADLPQWIKRWLNIAQDDGTYAAASQKYLGAVLGP